MKVINLMEDTAGEAKVYAEHGFCIYLETQKHRILADTGASEKTWENAKKLGVGLDTVDMVFLSHGHYDHSGGILSFAEQNPHAKIYIHARAGYDYFSFPEEISLSQKEPGCGTSYGISQPEKAGLAQKAVYGREKYIGIDKKILELPQLVILEKGCRIDQEISVFSEVTARRKWPKSNLRLKRKEGDTYMQDSFDHEQYMVVEAENKKLLISGCAHNGILNILDRFRELYQCDPDVVISGFHMVKKTDYASDEIMLIQDVAKELRKMDTRFYTGHCTGIPAFQMMKEIMGERLGYMHSGDRVQL